MAPSPLPALHPATTLDDLPDEILSKIYAERFSGVHIMFFGKSPASARLETKRKKLTKLLLVNKRYSAIAREAMLQNATVNADDPIRLTCECKELAKIRYVELPRDVDMFSGVDDLLRAMTSLKMIEVSNCITAKLITEIDGSLRKRKSVDLDEFLLQEMHKGAEWTKNIAMESLAIRPDDRQDLLWYRNYYQRVWLRDVSAGTAFADRRSPPKAISHIKLRSSKNGPQYISYDFSYHCDSKILYATIQGTKLSIKQSRIRSELAGGRSGREMLCGRSAINTTTRDTITNIIGRPLITPEKRLFNLHEFIHEPSRFPQEQQYRLFRLFTKCMALILPTKHV